MAKEKDSVSAEVTEAIKDERPAAPKKVKIMIRSADGKSGGDDVFVSCNGHAVLIKRDEPVTVDEGIYNALKDAVSTVYQTDANGAIIGHRGAPNYNVQVLG